MGLPDDYVRRRYLPEIEWDTIMLEELQRKKVDDETEMGETGFENPFNSGDMSFGGEETGSTGNKEKSGSNEFGF